MDTLNYHLFANMPPLIVLVLTFVILSISKKVENLYKNYLDEKRKLFEDKLRQLKRLPSTKEVVAVPKAAMQQIQIIAQQQQHQQQQQQQQSQQQQHQQHQQLQQLSQQQSPRVKCSPTKKVSINNNNFKGANLAQQSNKCECCSKTQVFFTPDKRFACCTLYDKVMYKNSYLICKNSICSYEHKLDELNSDGQNVQMMSFMTINNAKSSVYICMYRITSFIYRKLLVHLHSKRKINVKIITDIVTSDMEDYKHHKKVLKELRLAGIEIRSPIKYDHGNAKMHNKWIIVDEQVLLLGSLNLTNATRYNHEFVEKTTSESRVSTYVDQFNEMWKNSDCDPTLE